MASRGISICQIVPALCTFVKPAALHMRSVAEARADDKWIKDLKGCLTPGVIMKLLHVWDWVGQVAPLSTGLDAWMWKWSSSGAHFL
jgi:hypothetical protein